MLHCAVMCESERLNRRRATPGLLRSKKLCTVALISAVVLNVVRLVSVVASSQWLLFCGVLIASCVGKLKAMPAPLAILGGETCPTDS